MSESFPIYAGGEFTTTGKPLDVVSPYSAIATYRTYLGGEAEYERAVTAAEGAREAMRVLPTYLRYQILRDISAGILKHRELFAQIMAREAAKPLKTGRFEAERAAQTFLIASEEAKRLPGELLRLDWTPVAHGKEAIVKYFPVGLVAGISPFNFPLNLVAHKIAPAIAAGCPIVLKPASKTPISALLLARIIDETALPKGGVSMLPMDREIGNRLVTDARFNLLSFTGSPDVGWEMKKNAGKKKVVLNWAAMPGSSSIGTGTSNAPSRNRWSAPSRMPARAASTPSASRSRLRCSMRSSRVFEPRQSGFGSAIPRRKRPMSRP